MGGLRGIFSSFNSILVWLKVFIIQAKKRCRRCFNSILVWLKDATLAMEELLKTSFNSILVWLKVSLCKRFREETGCFNSILVWLKGIRLNDDGTPVKWFQFHFGLIKRQPTSCPQICFPLFQFHFGLIKRHRALCPRASEYVSIPFWSD